MSRTFPAAPRIPALRMTLVLAVVAALGACKSETAGTSGPAPAAAAPKVAIERCEERFGETARIETISPLRPGYVEIIMGAFDSKRRAACTATTTGAIVDWVDL